MMFYVYLVVPNTPGPLMMLGSTNDSLTASWIQTGSFSGFVVTVNGSQVNNPSLNYTSHVNVGTSDINITVVILNLLTAGEIYCLDVAAVSFELTSPANSTNCDFATGELSFFMSF